MVSISDERLRIYSGTGKGKGSVITTPQYPRVWEVVVMRKLTDTFAIDAFKLIDLDEPTRAVDDIESVCKAQLFKAMSRGFKPKENDTLVWKLTFDGTKVGGEDLLSFGLIPNSIGVQVQSSTDLFPSRWGGRRNRRHLSTVSFRC